MNRYSFYLVMLLMGDYNVLTLPQRLLAWSLVQLSESDLNETIVSYKDNVLADWQEVEKQISQLKEEERWQTNQQNNF